MSQQARGDETLLLLLHVMIKETEKLILETKATEDPHAMKLKAADALQGSTRTRSVALSNQQYQNGIFFRLRAIFEAVSVRLTYLMASD